MQRKHKKSLNNAKDILVDDEKRSIYDGQLEVLIMISGEWDQAHGPVHGALFPALIHALDAK